MKCIVPNAGFITIQLRNSQFVCQRNSNKHPGNSHPKALGTLGRRIKDSTGPAQYFTDDVGGDTDSISPNAVICMRFSGGSAFIALARC